MSLILLASAIGSAFTVGVVFNRTRPKNIRKRRLKKACRQVKQIRERIRATGLIIACNIAGDDPFSSYLRRMVELKKLKTSSGNPDSAKVILTVTTNLDRRFTAILVSTEQGSAKTTSRRHVAWSGHIRSNRAMVWLEITQSLLKAVNAVKIPKPQPVSQPVHAIP